MFNSFSLSYNEDLFENPDQASKPDNNSDTDSLESSNKSSENEVSEKVAKKQDTHPDLTDNSLIEDHSQGSVEDQITFGDQVEEKILETEMRQSYLKYAMSVIVSRALPDVRDGLKPVHRRILFAMNKMGLTPGAKFKKSANIVGEVLGKYHPHGDMSVYNAMVRMAQEFSLRYPLVDGQGNYGSVDGDSPAAYRYTEARMDKTTASLIADIEKDTVDFIDNYDGAHKEPTVLPTRIPNLIINGSTGIAVGMATEIPPHNLGEAAKAIDYLIHNPEASIEELAKFMPGPDFPTGGMVFGSENILKAYQTGRGKCLLRSKSEIQEDRIIVNEIPYQVNKANMISKIADLVKDKKIEGIRDIRDESNKEGIRIVIICKRDASPEVVLNQLYKMSDLQVWAHYNMLALVNRGRQPQVLNLKDILQEFIDHRYEVVTRRTEYEKAKAEAEKHILEGLKIALDFIDEVVALIRSSKDKQEAGEKLTARFKFSEKQTEAVLQMRLQTLTNLDKNKIETDLQVLIDLIKGLTEILEVKEVKQKVVADEIKEAADKYDNPRRTVLVDYSPEDVNKEDLVKDEEVLVQLTNSQYIKVLPIDTFRQQGRGGRGVTSFNPKDEDWVKSSTVAMTHDYIYAFTNTGRVFKTRVFEMPTGSRTGRGQSLINYFQLQEDEKITNILTIDKEKETDKEGSLIFATQNGIVKRTLLEDYKNIRQTGIKAITLKDDDKLISVLLSIHSDDKIILSSDNGKTAIFDKSQLSALGRTAMGVKGIKLKAKEKLISLEVTRFNFIDEESPEVNDDPALLSDNNAKKFPTLLVITKNGFGKQTYLAEYRKTKRAASGVKTLNMTTKTGQPVLIQILKGDEENLILTTKKGITIKIDPDTISHLGRSTQGVKVIKLEKGDALVSGSIN